jgi:signal transduction histidine kinase
MRKQLHDGLGQVLTSISFLASGLRARLRKCGDGDAAELDEIILLINEAIAESRAIAAACDNATRSTAQMIS